MGPHLSLLQALVAPGGAGRSSFYQVLFLQAPLGRGMAAPREVL